MANSIASAVAYINNDAALAKLYAAKSYTSDWTKENVAVGAKIVKYRQFSFSSNTLGTFNRETGYSAKDITSTWVEKELTQDKGDSLHLDKMDGEEAQFLEIVTVHNRYVNKIQIPSVDTYRFSAVVGNTAVESATGTISASDIEEKLDAAIDTFKNKGYTGNLVCHIAMSKARDLKTATKAKGSLSIGSWNGDATNQVLIYGDFDTKVKIVEVPDAIIGTGVNFIVSAPEAVAAMVKYKENEYFDRIPGFGGRRAQIDDGIYHDCWVEPGAEGYVYVHKVA